MILYHFMSEIKINNSKELADFLKVPHKKVMDFYWKLDDKVVENRNFIECTYVIDGKKRYLRNMCDSLIFAIIVQFMGEKIICV